VKVEAVTCFLSCRRLALPVRYKFVCSLFSVIVETTIFGTQPWEGAVDCMVGYYREKYRNRPGILDKGIYLPYHPVSCTGKCLPDMRFPCRLSGDLRTCHFLPADLAELSIRCVKNARPVRDFSDAVSFTIKDENAKTGILPAEVGAGSVNRAAGLVRCWEPEERAVHRADCCDILQAEEVGFVRVKDNLPFFAGN
jgi:hypothetical protein